MDNNPAKSYYEHSKNLEIVGGRIEGNYDCDVVVVGGGLTGCSTALHLAKKGVEVAVIESRHFGWGASGRSGGQIINGYACEQGALSKLVGERASMELWQHTLNAVDYTRELISEHDIQCDLSMGYLHVAAKQRQARELELWVKELRETYDYDAMEFLEKKALQTILGSELYQSGVLDPQSGHLHPLNYCLGIARAAADAGARLFEHSPVHSIQARSDGYTLSAGSASVNCNNIVYACNAYLDNLVPEITNKIMPVGTYIVATEPLTEEVALGLISNRAAVADTNFVLDYYRLSADNRMLFGGRVSYSTLQPMKLVESLRHRMLRVFPQLTGVKIDFSWGGYVAITRNRAPHIGKTRDGGWFAHGYSGHGMALTGYIGKLLSQAVLGDESELECFQNIPHSPFPGGRLLRMPALVAAMGYYKFKDRL